MKSFETVDEYLSEFSSPVLEKLRQLRAIIHATAPEATEKIAYAIPTFYYKGNLVHFGGYKNHIGFYTGSHAAKAFESELADYSVSKGTIRFPHHQALPEALIQKIVKFRMKDNEEIEQARKNKARKPLKNKPNHS